MKVLIACEYSGRVRDAFLRRGHEAMSCDLLPTDAPGPHYQGNVLDIINDGWDLMIAHPDCTYLTCSAEWAYTDGPYHQKVKPGTLVGAERREARDQAIEFVRVLYDAPIERIAIENPIGALSKRFREPDQFIQPYEYGDSASKKTCLFLKNLPLLKPTSFAQPRLALTKDGRSYALRWDNQTDSGQNRESPGDDRWKIRSTTWQGWADAMADQWGGQVCELCSGTQKVCCGGKPGYFECCQSANDCPECGTVPALDDHTGGMG